VVIPEAPADLVSVTKNNTFRDIDKCCDAYNRLLFMHYRLTMKQW